MKAFLKGCGNGASELMANISMSLVSMVYNFQLLRFAGEDGVAAYGVLMYVNFVFVSIYIGYSVGTAPIVGYNFGAKNTVEMKGILKKSAVLISLFSVAMLASSLLLANPLSQMFVGYDAQLTELTLRGFKIFSFSFLFAGVAIYGSSFFTALNNGLVSAIISFLRTLVFQIVAVLVLPEIWGIDGVWASIVVSEFLALITTLAFILANRKKYGYM